MIHDAAGGRFSAIDSIERIVARVTHRGKTFFLHCGEFFLLLCSQQ
ncbi:hypothetical protein [Blastopirellula marina]|nr:hypothetical protein [Blastopirellula marina]